ncbi:MAG: polyprenyl synthetase family protein [Firmicutes bacterium]|nr:polyprenyl synthetase family protein [Bacillota bacterium]
MMLEQFMAEHLPAIEKELEECLPPEAAYPEKLHQAMRYSTLGGGKRLRALLAVAAAEMAAKDRFTQVQPAAYRLAAAVEMLHAYSLIHDDLPCMDDDDFRRGRPSNHKVFGEAVAVLAGDALLTESFALLGQLEDLGIPVKVVVAVIREMAQAGGSRGLIGGQAVDLASEGRQISQETLEYIHTHKTGALFRAVVRCGALLGGADEAELAAVTLYAEHFGLCFQIIDDILDVVGDEAKLGKKVGSDAEQGKVTYVTLYGLEEARALALKAMEEAREAVADFQGSEVLASLAMYIVQRDH